MLRYPPIKIYWHISNGALHMYSELFRIALDYFWNQLYFNLSKQNLEDYSTTNFAENQGI